jgi:hypothetical protein
VVHYLADVGDPIVFRKPDAVFVSTLQFWLARTRVFFARAVRLLVCVAWHVRSNTNSALENWIRQYCIALSFKNYYIRST